MGGHQKWRLILKDILTRVFLNGSIIVALFILISRYLAPILRKVFTNIYVSELFILLIALLAAAPFFWGMVLSKNLSHEMAELYQDVVTRRARKFIFYLRSSLALILCFLIIFYGLSLKVSLFLVFVLLWGYYFFFRRYMGSIYRWFEKGLSTTYESQETHSDGPKNQLDHQKLAPWNQQLEELEVPPMSLHVGKTLEELSLRERCGVNIALIKRGEMTIAAPHKNDRIFPYDKLYAIGDEKAMESFFQFFKSHLHCDPEMMNLTEVSLLKHQVLPGSSLIGRTIRESGIRERTKALVVGIERQGQRILSPDSQLEILVGDLLLLVGDRSKVEWIEHVNPSH